MSSCQVQAYKRALAKCKGLCYTAVYHQTDAG